MGIGQGSCLFTSGKRSLLSRHQVSKHSSNVHALLHQYIVLLLYFSFLLFVVGNYVPIDQVRDDIASAYEKEVECQALNMLLMYKNMCDLKV
jgi:hypothetical protein